MLKIRLFKKGSKNNPFFYIVVSNSNVSRNGKFLEKIGYFNMIKKNNIYINLFRIKFWINNGAKLTKVVKKLIKNYK